jgi:DNA (cytosine-5)-methyltransferase 1
MNQQKRSDAFERTEISSRVGEILRSKYFLQLRNTRSPRISATQKPDALEPMLGRLGIDFEDFDSVTTRALFEHRRAVCKPKPLCRACPLVSFCTTGQERVRKNGAPVVVDLFGGVGGMGSGFIKAGFRVGLAVEYDRNAAQTYRLNNPGVHVEEADVAGLDARAVRKIVGSRPAVICAGPPCQSYSLAGERKSRDPRHHLFRHVLALARGLKPDIVLIENVPGIGMSFGSRNFLQILESELGEQFTAEVHLLRALDYGVPQVRRRYFFIGHLNDGTTIGAPRPTHKEKGMLSRLPGTPTVMEVLRGIPRREHSSCRDWARTREGIIWNVGTMRHSSRVIRKIRKIRGVEGPLSYRRVSRKYANTIIAGHRALPVHPTMHRTLSVREAAQIQGFSKDYVFLGARANQPLQVANAVPPPLAFAIARHLKRSIHKRI